MFRTAIKSVCTAAVVFAASVSVSSASTYKATNVKTGSNFHTFYFSPAKFGGGNKHWQFDGGFGTFDTYDVGADSFISLTGTIFQNAPTPDAANRFDVDVTFKQAAGAQNGVKCGGGCGDVANWEYYTFDKAILEGVAGSVSGLVLSLFDRPGAPIGQLGYGANDKDGGFGFSDWFSWEVETANGQFGLAVGDGGYGDINVQLSSMPLPAGAVLLITGLFGMGAMRKLRKS